MAARTRTRPVERVLPGTVAGADADRDARLAVATARLLELELTRACDPANPAPFTAFAPIFGVQLTPGQHAIASVLYDGQAPSPEFVDSLFGGMSTAPPRSALHTVLAVCGRGGGKTSQLIAGRALHLALTVDLSPLARGEAGLVPIVAPDQRQSRHALAFVKGILTTRPALADILKYDETLDVVRLTRPDGRQVTIEARPATSGGKAVRGPSLAGVLLDECAFFHDEGHAVSDIEIYRAARPRLLPGAQIVLATTPWAQAGLVWDLFRENFGDPKRATVAKAPTVLLRPSPETESMVAVEREADPDNAAREFDAEFLSADAERLFPESLIEGSVDRALEVPVQVWGGEKVRAGADFAFDSDSSALVCLVERAPCPLCNAVAPLCGCVAPPAASTPKPSRFVVCELAEERPSFGAHLIPSEVVANFSRLVHRAGAKMVVADAHYRRSIEEELGKHELGMVPSPPVPAESFLVVRALMAAGRVRLPNHPRLLAQLRKVRSTHKPGGHVSIHQPRARDGGHGDIVSALVCALSGVTLTARYAVEGPKTDLQRQIAANEARRKGVFMERDRIEQKKDARMVRSIRSRFGHGVVSALKALRG